MSSNGNIFHLLALCAGYSAHKGQWHWALMFSLICACINHLGKQSWGWWFEMPLPSLWCHCNVLGDKQVPEPVMSSPTNAVWCHYNMVQYNTILHIALQWLGQNIMINQNLNSQKTPHTLPWRASYGMSIVRKMDKINYVITVLNPQAWMS